MLIHALLQRLNGTTAVALVTNSRLPFDGILEYVLEDFGIGKGGDSRAQRLVALNTFLLERRRAGQNTALILDEAQNLDADTLEEVRLLSNFETMTDKLLQIVLAGQPELRAKLDLPELRQLKQRIGLRCRISALAADEVGEYIRTRLRVAGARDLGLFSDRAVARITEYSGGIPRLVNIVCDHALLIGYADQKRRIERGMVEQAIEYLEEGRRPRRRPRPAPARSAAARLWWAAGAATAALLGVVGGALAWHPDTALLVARSLRELLTR
jgi:general secretion pathway protein A